MSTQSRLIYDSCAYEQKQTISAGIGKYQAETPRPYCSGCFPTDSIRITRLGGTNCQNVSQIDIDSEMKLITQKAGVCDKNNGGIKCDSYNFVDCQYLPTESTRLQNPPSTMRCTGVNRFENLNQDPQNYSFRTRDLKTFNISNRIIVKDNHRPLQQTPINQSPLLPYSNRSDAMYNGINTACLNGVACKKNTEFDVYPSITWKTFDK